MLDLYIDLDAHTVYPQALRAAQHHALDLYVVTKDYLPADTNIHLIVAEDGPINGSAWIAANIARGDICITGDSALAASCVLRGALVLAPSGRPWGPDTVNSLSDAWSPDTRGFSQQLERAIVATRAVSPRTFASSHRFARTEPAVSRHRVAMPHAVVG